MPWPKGKPRSAKTIQRIQRAVAGRWDDLNLRSVYFAAAASGNEAMRIQWDAEMVMTVRQGLLDGLSDRAIARKVGVSDKTLRRWVNANNRPAGHKSTGSPISVAE